RGSHCRGSLSQSTVHDDAASYSLPARISRGRPAEARAFAASLQDNRFCRRIGRLEALRIEHVESSTGITGNIIPNTLRKVVTREENHTIDAVPLIVSNERHLLTVLESQSSDEVAPLSSGPRLTISVGHGSTVIRGSGWFALSKVLFFFP